MITKENISDLRDRLLELHSALLEYQKYEYEQNNQPIVSPAQYFQLVTGDPSFAWLRSISELIVGLDEMCDEPEEINEEKAQSLFEYTKKLLSPSETGNDFATKYQTAMQKSSDVGLRHGQVMKLLEV